MAKIGLLLSTVLLAACAVPGEDPPERPPNVVLFFADDLGYGDLSSYGHPTIRTPNLDALAAGGQRWTNFYVAAPVCSPSRAALLTGKEVVRTGLYGEHIAVMFPNDPGGLPDAEQTIAEALKTRGYATGIIGKWHLGDRVEAYPTRHGFDYWFGLPYSNDMRWSGRKTFDELMALSLAGDTATLQAELAERMPLYLEPESRFWDVPTLRSVRDGDGFVDEVVHDTTPQTTLTEDHTREAEQFIERHQEQPFFLYVPYSMPHTPLFASEPFAGRSTAGLYGDVVEELDASVGRIIATLERLNLSERTLVIFTSDNGPWRSMLHHGGSAGLLKDGKGTTFEGGMRVPALFYWPGVVAPEVRHDIGSTLDVAATLRALTGEADARTADGYDLSATLLNGRPSPRQHIAYYRNGELQAFRSGAYKLRLISAGAYGLPPERVVHEQPQLFDLNVDPAERFDLAEQRPEVVARLQDELAAHLAATPRKPPQFDARLVRAMGGG